MALGGTVAVVSVAGLAAAASASASASPVTDSPTQVVSYHGYQVTVPASWPVYNLETDPSRCVLFDVHAVYLGAPGANQVCPARAYGRTEAIEIQSADGAAGSTSSGTGGSGTTENGTAAGDTTGPAAKSAIVLPQNAAALPVSAALPASAAKTDAVSHEILVEAPGPGVLVTATYGSGDSQVRSILASGKQTSASTSPSSSGSSSTGSSGSSSSSSASSSGTSSYAGTATSKAASAATRTSKTSQAAASSSASTESASGTASASEAAASPASTSTSSGGTSASGSLTGTAGSGLGFDACTAPSEATMKDWLASPYRTIGTYLGGVNWACDYGNFNAEWVQQVSAEGWRFIPIWVGEQAPCSTISGAALINPADAVAEGTAEAADAVTTAQSFGYGTGSTLYYDMEGYSTSASGCSQAVLTFLSAWTQGLHAAGYKSGVYSSAGSGITDLTSEYGATTYDGAPYESPDAVWIADWDGNPDLTGDPYVPDSDWPVGQRLRQFAGSRNETWGGTTVNIDPDIIGGPVDSLAGAHVDAGPSLLSGADAVSTPAGEPATIRLTLRGTPTTPAAESWQADPPAGITVTPAGGRITVPPGHPVTLRLTVTPSAGTAAGRYDVPVTISEHGKPIAETFELVSVTPSGTALATAHPIVLYAADATSVAEAKSIAAADALPASDVTGTFTTAWNDLTGGKDLVIAVGDAAVDGLFHNACGWAGPSGSAGSTPFYYLGTPYQSSPGADIYEPADGTTDANSALLAAQLAHYALAGTLPDYQRPITQMPRPADTCLGSASVPVS
jgi:hypothetical protein